METRLIDKNWGKELAALAKNSSSLRIICPFIKIKGLEYLQIKHQEKIQVITRFNEHDFFNGVSDIAALHQLLERGAEIRGVRGLHSKVYLFGETHAVVTSANLTQSAMTTNHEFGVVSENSETIDQCHEYFDGLWERAGDNLTRSALDESEGAVAREKEKNGGPRISKNLKDKGSKTSNILAPSVQASTFDTSPQSLVKFLGGNANRVLRSCTITEEIKRSGCCWALGYPHRPRRVQEGAVIFFGRMVKEPDDILVFGRAIGMKHDSDRDMATDEEMKLRDKGERRWPYYVRVKQVNLVKGTLVNGVSLYEMMDDLRERSFSTTLERASNGEEQPNPRLSVRQNPDVRLAPAGLVWLEKRLQAAFSKHGKLTEADLRKIDGLYWPDVNLD